jgi:hypothetical protein
MRASLIRVAPFAIASILAGPASAAITVSNPAEFQAAVARLRLAGGTIVLRPSRYGELVVSARGARRLHVVARPGASAGRVVLDGAQAVRFVGLAVTPSAQDAHLVVSRSHRIAFERLTVRGGGRRRANASVLDSADVRFSRSSFSRCGEGKTPNAGYCLRVNRNRRLVVASSRFTDCFGCDFVHGAGNWGLSIVASTLERALVGRCGRSIRRCHHQDLIHLGGGRRLRFDRNRFGIYQTPGAAQIYLTAGIRGVTVTNNVFLGTDPRLPGYSAPNALWIGNRLDADVPRDVVIANNTILTGRPRRVRGDNFVTAASVVLSPVYNRLPISERPIVANNVIRLVRTWWRLCAQVRAAVSNLIVSGRRCSPDDHRGDPRVDARGRPTAASTLLFDRANRRYATRYDILRVPRGDKPDIGAYEYVRP